MKKQSTMRKKAMNVSTLTRLRLLLRNALGPKKSKFAHLEYFKDVLKKLDSAPNKVRPPEEMAMREAIRRKLIGHIEGTEKYLANARRKQDEVLMPLRLSALLGLGGAATYGGYKMIDSMGNSKFMDNYKLIDHIENPESVKDYKLAADRWVSGFITKCADYNVDGLALLDTLCSGDIKKAGLGRTLLTTLIGSGILGTGVSLFSLARKNKNLEAQKGQEEAKKLDEEQRKMWENENNPRNLSYLNHLRNEPKEVKELTQEQKDEIARKQNYANLLAAETSENIRRGRAPSLTTTNTQTGSTDQTVVTPQRTNNSPATQPADVNQPVVTPQPPVATGSDDWYVPPLTLGSRYVPNIKSNIKPITASRPAPRPAPRPAAKLISRIAPKKGKIFGVDEDKWFTLPRDQQQAIINNAKITPYRATGFNQRRLS